MPLYNESVMALCRGGEAKAFCKRMNISVLCKGEVAIGRTLNTRRGEWAGDFGIRREYEKYER